MPDKKYVNIYEFCQMKVAIGDAKAAVVDDSQKAYQVHIVNSYFSSYLAVKSLSQESSEAYQEIRLPHLIPCCQDAFEISKSKMQPTHPIRWQS